MSRPNAGTKGVPRPEREDQILAAATRAFGTLGYAATSVAAVAEQAGISKPLVYSYFGSKEGLFTETLRRSGDQLAAEMERVARTGVVGLERGLRTLEALFEMLEPQPWVWLLIFDATAPETGEVAAVRATYTARITALAEDGVAELAGLVGITDPLDVSAGVAVWMSMVDAIVGWWVEHPDQTAAAMSQRCARMFAAATGADLSRALA